MNNRDLFKRFVLLACAEILIITGTAFAQAEGNGPAPGNPLPSITDLSNLALPSLPTTPPSLNSLPALPQMTGTSTDGSAPCPAITSTLSPGSSGDSVTSLQEFLISLGLLPAGDATGYFGKLTSGAVADWQSQNGLPSVGVVGPLTKQALNNCASSSSGSGSNSGPESAYPADMSTTSPGGILSTPPGQDRGGVVFSASPTSGSAPLSVTFTATASAALQQGDSYVVDYGDSNRDTMTASGSDSYTASHSYATSGTFTAKLYLERNICGGVQTLGCTSDLQVGSATMTVGGGAQQNLGSGSANGPVGAQQNLGGGSVNGPVGAQQNLGGGSVGPQQNLCAISGSYSQSCTSCSVSNGTMSCICETETGVWQGTTLDVQTCTVPVGVWNSNGNLLCNAAAGGSLGGQGASNSCTGFYLSGAQASNVRSNQAMSQLANALTALQQAFQDLQQSSSH